MTVCWTTVSVINSWTASPYMFDSKKTFHLLAWHWLEFIDLDSLLFSFLFYTLLIPCGEFGPPYQGKVTAAARAALPSRTSACWVSLCFCNAPNSDMNYRIFNVCTWSFLCVCIHVGVWVKQQRVSTTFFYSERLSHFFLCFWRDSNLVHAWNMNLSLTLPIDSTPIWSPLSSYFSVGYSKHDYHVSAQTRNVIRVSQLLLFMFLGTCCIGPRIQSKSSQTGDGAQWLVSWNSNPKTLGLIPWWGRVRDSFSIPLSQLLCRLVCAWPPFVYSARTQTLCAR